MTTTTETIDGTRYEVTHIAGDVYALSPIGKGGKPLKCHRPAKLRADGSWYVGRMIR